MSTSKRLHAQAPAPQQEKTYTVLRGLNWKPPCDHPEDECGCVEQRWEPGDIVSESVGFSIEKLLARGAIEEVADG